MEAVNMKLKYDTEFTKIVQQTHIPPQVQIMEALLAHYHLKPMNDLSIFMYPRRCEKYAQSTATELVSNVPQG